MGMQRLSCVFYVKVVSVEDLPAAMERLLLTVNVYGEGNYVYAKPSRVSNGGANFNETLVLKCYIDCNLDGKNGIEFETKLFSLQFIAISGGRFGEKLDYIGLHTVNLGDIIKKSIEGNKCAKGIDKRLDFSGKGRGGAFHLKFGYKITQTPTKEGMFDWLFKRNRDYTRIPFLSQEEMSSFEAIDQGGDTRRNPTLKEMVDEENARHRTDMEDGMDGARFYAAQDLAVYKDVTIWGELKSINGYKKKYTEKNLVLKMDEHCIGLALQGPNITARNKPDVNDYGIYIMKTEYSKHISKYHIVLLRDTSSTFNVYINSEKVRKNEYVQVEHGDYISLHDLVDEVAIGFVYCTVANWEKEGPVDPFKELSNKLEELKDELTAERRSIRYTIR